PLSPFPPKANPMVQLAFVEAGDIPRRPCLLRLTCPRCVPAATLFKKKKYDKSSEGARHHLGRCNIVTTHVSQGVSSWLKQICLG
ncbi:hypothetical protein Q6247_25380, partial [Klebsiella pneumoniae]